MLAFSFGIALDLKLQMTLLFNYLKSFFQMRI